jgi:hypothetical protein
LGIKEGFEICLINAPDYYFSLFTDLPVNLSVKVAGEAKLDFVHFFTKQKIEFEHQLPLIRAAIKQNGMIWVSWLKKASKIPTDMTEDIIRNYALQIGLVDIKVCAVDENWSD